MSTKFHELVDLKGKHRGNLFNPQVSRTRRVRQSSRSNSSSSVDFIGAIDPPTPSACKEKTTNANGRILLELCTCAELIHLTGLRCSSLQFDSAPDYTRTVSRTVINYFFSSSLLLPTFSCLEVAPKYASSDHSALYLSFHESQIVKEENQELEDSSSRSRGWKFHRLPMQLTEDSKRRIAPLFSIDDARALQNSILVDAVGDFLHQCLLTAISYVGVFYRVDDGIRELR